MLSRRCVSKCIVCPDGQSAVSVQVQRMGQPPNQMFVAGRGRQGSVTTRSKPPQLLAASVRDAVPKGKLLGCNYHKRCWELGAKPEEAAPAVAALALGLERADVP